MKCHMQFAYYRNPKWDFHLIYTLFNTIGTNEKEQTQHTEVMVPAAKKEKVPTTYHIPSFAHGALRASENG